MKRWNQKGSVHAKRRMAELRDRKRQITKSILILEWARATGRDPKEWWVCAQLSGVKAGCGVEASIAFLRSGIDAIRAAA